MALQKPPCRNGPDGLKWSYKHRHGICFFFPYNFNQGGSEKTQDLQSPDVLLSEAPDASTTKNTWEAHSSIKPLSPEAEP